MEEKNQSVDNSCCVKNRTPFLIGVLGFLIIGWVFLTFVDKLGLGMPTPFSKRMITVVGSANRQENNQLASFNATISSKNADKATAVSEVNQKSEKLIIDLKNFGIADKDLKTQSLNIYREQSPYWEDGIQKYRDGDWNASISVDIILRDVSKSGDLMDLLAKADTSNIWGPNYALKESEPEKSDLLRQAYDNAKTNAEVLAGEMNLSLGKVLSVVEGFDYNPSYPFSRSGMEAGGGGGGLEPGSSAVFTNLTVTFELK